MSLNITTAFYDAMFGRGIEVKDLTAVEAKTLANVRSILNAPDKLSSHIPPLPVTLIQLLELLKDPNADFMEIAKLIDNDPSLAVEVLRVANTPVYFRGSAEITSLKRAVGLLGVKGVAEIATSVMVEKVRPPKPIYYKMFGKLIWVHSLHCAFLNKLLAVEHGDDEFSGHFLGLIHDIGKIIIFNCLCEAFQSEAGGAQPGSLLFKQMMAEMSGDISSFVAEEWDLPEIFVTALKQQRTGAESGLARALLQANQLSEAYLLLKKQLITDEEALSVVQQLEVPESVWQQFLDVAVEIELGVK